MRKQVIEEEKEAREKTKAPISSQHHVRQRGWEINFTDYQDGLRAQLEYAADLNFLIPPLGRTSSMPYPRGAS